MNIDFFFSPKVNVAIQKGIADDSLIQDNKIQGVQWLQKSTEPPCGMCLVAQNGRGGGTEGETKLTLTITIDRSPVLFPSGVPEVKPGEEAAAQGRGVKGFSVSHSDYLGTEGSHALGTKEITDLVSESLRPQISV